MKSLIYNISIILFVCLFLLTTSGFFLFQHYCPKSKTLQTSILVESNCNHLHNEFDCCSVESAVADCSHSDCISNSSIKKNHDNDNSCKNSAEFLKIKKLYTSTNKIQISNLSEMIIGLITSLFLYEDLPQDAYYSDIIIPPRLFGKKLIYFLHQLKVFSLVI